MRWSIPRAMLALVMMMVMCLAPLVGASAQESDFNATLKAAEQGDVVAQLELGLMYDQGLGVAQDYGKARTWYLKAAEQGLAAAQYNLGIMYYEGQGVAQNYGKAHAWYQKAAEQGDAAAQYNLGVTYVQGQGVRKDYMQAYKWAALSAEQGEKDAAKFRDAVAKEMTPSQLAEAERLVAEWKRK